MTQALALYSLACFAATFIGGILPIYFGKADSGWLRTFVAFGAGLLLGTALLHMLPHAAELLPHTFGVYTLGGFVLLLGLERFVMIHSCEEHSCNYHTVGMTAFFGLGVHALLEGLALASTVASPTIGPLILVAVLSHKIPEALTLTSLLKMGHKKFSQILLFTLGIALATPLGIFLGVTYLKMVSWDTAAGILLSISAGTFLYIASCDLLPELHRQEGERFRRLLAFLAGIGLCIIGHHLGHA